jgi:cell division protein FtsB
MAYSKNRLSHKRELYYIICIVSFIVIMLVSLFGPGGYRDLRKAKMDLKRQQERVDELERSNQERRQSIERLRSDKDTLEGIARERGYGRQDEIIQQLPPEP